jgi:hypothetical protein
MKIVRKLDNAEINWKDFKYMVFDIPNHPGKYTERYEALGIFSYIRLKLIVVLIF